MRVCSIDGCEKPLLAKGYCRFHYRQFHTVLCSVEGCEKSHDAKGYCTQHYAKWKRFGDPNFIFVKKVNKCSIEGCENKYKARGLCNHHYKSFIRLGHPLASSIKYDSCSISNCERASICKGLCHKHYYRFQNGLDLTAKTNVEMTIDERIKENIEIDDLTGCWNWLAAKASHGYGTISYNHKNHRTHRLSYIIFVGPITDNLSVLHKCDNVACCNPRHLFLGTQKDNIQDMILKGRAKFGRNKCQTQS